MRYHVLALPVVLLLSSVGLKYWFPKHRYEFVETDELTIVEKRMDMLGGESFTEDAHGFIYAGLFDGRVVRLHPQTGELETILRLGDEHELCGTREMMETCGRPLAVAVNPINPESELLVCDGSSASRGLMSINVDEKTKKTLVSSADGSPIVFCNSMVATPEGLVIFTQSSDKYSAQQWQYDILRGKPSGRLLAYNLRTGEVISLVEDLYFANGVILLPDRKSLLVSTTGDSSILKLSSVNDMDLAKSLMAKHSSGYTTEQLADLPFLPDNLTLNPRNGAVLVAAPMARTVLSDLLTLCTGQSELKTKIPLDIFEKIIEILNHRGRILELDGSSGEILRVFYEPSGVMKQTSEAFIPQNKTSVFYGKMLIGTYGKGVPVLITEAPAAT